MILWYNSSIQGDRIPPVIWYALWLLPILIGRTSNFTCKVRCKPITLSAASYSKGQQPPSSNTGYISVLLRHSAEVNQSWAIYGPKHDVAVWLVANKSVCEVWLSPGKRTVCHQTSTCLIVRQPTTGRYTRADSLVSCSEARPLWQAGPQSTVIASGFALGVRYILQVQQLCWHPVVSFPGLPTSSLFQSRDSQWKGFMGKNGTGIAWNMGGMISNSSREMLPDWCEW